VNTRLVLNIVLGAAILACIAGAAVLILGNSRSPDGIEVILPPPTPVLTESQPASQVVVYVSGAVMRPGVYTLNSEHRVAEALGAAGGPTSDADLDRINLAMRLNDEDQIHVPSVGDGGSTGVGSVLPAGSSPSTSSGKLNVNTATVEELESLPGIGASRAAAIVEYRNTHGPFQRVEDLVEVSGIGDGILGSIRNLIEIR
jgi:competence protein ComEA